MTTNDAVSTHECPACGEVFDSEKGVKIHHAKTHGESLNATEETCHTCGESFTERRDRDRDVEHRFCSRECYDKHLRSRTGEGHPNWTSRADTNCAQCGGVLKRPRWQVEQNDRQFCDQSCLGEWLSENKSGEASVHFAQVSVDCGYCGEEILKPQSRIDGRRHFCDLRCHGMWLSENKTGKDANGWQGGHDLYYGPNWNKQRRKARERDGHVCQSCMMSSDEHHDEWGEELHVHHIKRFGAFDSYQNANRLENLVTLCRPCHLGKWEGIPLRPDTRTAAD